MTTGGCAHLVRSLQDVRRTATPAHGDWLPVAVNQPELSLFTRYHECQGERYRADSNMSSPSASAQRSVRRRVVGPRLPIYKKYKKKIYISQRNMNNELDNTRKVCRRTDFLQILHLLRRKKQKIITLLKGSFLSKNSFKTVSKKKKIVFIVPLYISKISVRTVHVKITASKPYEIFYKISYN